MLRRRSPTAAPPEPARSFDPHRLGRLETAAWVAYYRRQWVTVLTSSVGLVRAGFGMDWGRTLRGAWFVLRANQVWAPFPDNDPEGARRYMERFYRLVANGSGNPVDTVEAARLEVDWWRAHREAQHGEGAGTVGDGSHAALVDAVARLYAFVYDVAVDEVRPAAAHRAAAMVVSDRWVTAGCDPDSALIAEERALLVRSYAALLAAVHR